MPQSTRVADARLPRVRLTYFTFAIIETGFSPFQILRCRKCRPPRNSDPSRVPLSDMFSTGSIGLEEPERTHSGTLKQSR